MQLNGRNKATDGGIVIPATFLRVSAVFYKNNRGPKRERPSLVAVETVSMNFTDVVCI